MATVTNPSPNNAPASSPVAPATPAKPSGTQIDWRAWTMVAALAVIWILFTALTRTDAHPMGAFISFRNLTQLTRQMVVTSLLGIGMVLVIVSGQIDLSVGRLAGLVGGAATMAYVTHSLPLPVAVLIGCAVGLALGALQGALVAWFDIPSFIVTLGGMLVFRGALEGLVTQTISPAPESAFLWIGTRYVPAAAGWAIAGVAAAAFVARAAMFSHTTTERARYAGLAALALIFTGLMNAYQGIPVSVLLLLLLTGALWVVGQHTPFGRHLYAIGGNKEAAFYSGINIKKHIIAVFALMGLMSAVAGITLTAWLGSATSSAGENMELDAIAAAVIGGTSLQGGRGTVWGALLGALVMVSLDNGMSLMNVRDFWQFVIKGLILVAAVAVDMAGRKGR